ncbi:Rhs element Vgr protein [Flavobacterium covae]|uniref:Type VI secretion system tip protein VgrG n=1 Tax=Flavobacterium covae TaxID=2906076 RepID=A0ABW8PGA5_9FLAO|nr:MULTISPECIES: type VI secretion system tip protein VgrG [Flavobacterium]OWP82358.1 Rhs element Vgr protein [Flavobacterium covae]OWP87234.1 Rhs element Vgr protein [Flavobacterium covae]OXA83385.1 Rhs element Vgr protein [Flavobacterium columnare] [Flavobacterium columnare NBRC 100251 = ATCC 23463]POR20769.1 Rhs element Vgr protein [Flavobacterium columnare]
MPLKDTDSKNPIKNGLEEVKTQFTEQIKQESIKTIETEATQKVSEQLSNPAFNQLVANKDTIKSVGNYLNNQKTNEMKSFDNSGENNGLIGRLNHPDDLKKHFSKKTFHDFLNEKDSPLVYCTLRIDGKDFLAKNTYTVDLKQFTNEHDIFTIITPDDSLDSFEGYVMENSKNILGKKISINFHRFGSITQTFTGIIANIRNKKDEGGGYGKLYITGHSPSILLENGKDCQSYENKKLDEIIKQALAEYNGEVAISTKNINTDYTIPYCVQYKESDYQFIKRLAHRYGEYFYYDGESLIFGNEIKDTIELGENIDLIDIEFEMMIKPQLFKYLSYDSISAEVKEKDSDAVKNNVQRKTNPFQQAAIEASEKVFRKKSEMLFNATSQQTVEKDLKEMARRQKESREHTMQVRGRSRDPKLRIGGKAKISDINAKAMETYRIIEIYHYHDGSEYYNEFVGIPDIFISPFFDEDAFPTCEEQSAIVMQNDNPQGMIKVQFPWQKKKGLTTPWLRVVTPYAGKGKGMHIIPEVGEEVIIGFDNGNAERPFVFGAMFNGKASAGKGGSGNYIKGLQTASGNKLHMDDNAGSVHLTDKGSVDLKFDGAGNATVNANESITFTCGGAEIKMTKDGTIVISGDVKVKIETKEAEITGTTSVKTNSESLIEEKAPKIGINGETEVAIESTTVNVNGSAMTNVKGGIVNLN